MRMRPTWAGIRTRRASGGMPTKTASTIANFASGGSVASVDERASGGIVLAVFVGIPPLARRVRIPAQVGLILMGVLLGPHVLGLYGESRPTAEFFSELGKLLLLFSIGLEVDVERFRGARFRSIVLGSLTTLLPLAFGATVALLLGAGVLPALAIGCLVAPHSLVALPSVRDTRAEPVLVTIGATVLSDALALILFGLCVRSFESGFSWSGLGVQVLGIVLLLPLVAVAGSVSYTHLTLPTSDLV